MGVLKTGGVLVVTSRPKHTRRGRAEEEAPAAPDASAGGGAPSRGGGRGRER